MPLCSSAGFDLYVDSPEDKVSRFYNVFKPYIGMDDGYTSEINFSSKKLRYLTVNFPSYSNVSALYIGICEGARLEHGLKYRNVLPIVYYGSSITQGACSSRPGNAFANIISRRTSDCMCSIICDLVALSNSNSVENRGSVNPKPYGNFR